VRAPADRRSRRHPCASAAASSPRPRRSRRLPARLACLASFALVAGAAHRIAASPSPPPSPSPHSSASPAAPPSPPPAPPPRASPAAPPSSPPAPPPRASPAAPPSPPPAPPPSASPAALSPILAFTEALGAADPRDVDRAVAAITARPSSQSDPDVLFAAARACEDKLHDPGRAAAIYARVVADHPSARVANAAARRLDALRPLIGDRGQSADRAAQLAQLIAHADARPADDVLGQASSLSAARWPGAPAAALWLADWLRRSERRVEAQAHYARVVARWPGSPEARTALRGGAGVALDARNWPLAEALARQLPVAEPADRDVRDDLLRLAARGRRRDQLYLAAWLAITAAALWLLGSLGLAARRAPPGHRRAALRPPIEVVFLAPIAGVLIGVAFTAHRLIAPAVATISIGGLVLAYLSGATLEALRARGRARRLRSLAHVLVCLVAVIALVFVAVTRDHLLDLLIETVRFGPDV
jgi:hypothetical protein